MEPPSLIQITTNQVLKVCLHYGKIWSELADCIKTKCFFCLSETTSLIQITTNQVLKVCLHYGKIWGNLVGCVKTKCFSVYWNPVAYYKLLQNKCYTFTLLWNLEQVGGLYKKGFSFIGNPWHNTNNYKICVKGLFTLWSNLERVGGLCKNKIFLSETTSLLQISTKQVLKVC